MNTHTHDIISKLLGYWAALDYTMICKTIERVENGKDNPGYWADEPMAMRHGYMALALPDALKLIEKLAAILADSQPPF